MADIQVLKAAAIETVRSLNLDVAVRNASKLGEYDGTANYDLIIRRDGPPRHHIRVRSTLGGAYSAQVYIDPPDHQSGLYLGLEVYNATGYGQQLVTFKTGWWVAIIQELSFRYLTKDRVETLISDDEAHAAELDHFTPLPD